jgi:type I restriction enzyme R subunit
MKILQVNPLDALGSPLEIVELFGGKIGYLQALGELELEIYRSVA